jgi:hypothetical protein
MDAIAFGSIEEGNKHMTRKTTRQNTAPRADVYEEVTAQIIAMLEAGTRPWSPRWAARGNLPCGMRAPPIAVSISSCSGPPP